MTIKLRIENQDASRCLVVVPYDQPGDDGDARAADPIVVLPGSSAVAVVHELRTLHVLEGEIVREPAPEAAAVPVAPEGDAAPVGGVA